MDGPRPRRVADWMTEDFHPGDAEPADVGKVLIDSGADVLINFLPAASDEATRYYADQAINVAKIGFVNGMPSPVANDPGFQEAPRPTRCP